jgi:hypothetical protein
VLLKFKLLEWQTRPEAEVLAWALATPYFRLIHSRLPDASLQKGSRAAVRH